MDVLKLSNIFYKIASLKSDMATRIMYGIVSSMSETIDYPALELAVAGAKDVIKFGAISCYIELEFYRGYVSYDMLPDFEKYKNNEVNKNTLPTYISYLELFEDIFMDDENWSADYGGKAWAKIANTLKNIAVHYLQFLTNPKYSKENIKAANDTIIYLNVFDGLAHNTFGIYSSLLAEEFKGKNIKTKYEDVENLMNAKELKDPIDVYNAIKKDLQIDLPYKEYIQKLRQDPNFFNRNTESIKEELSTVKFIREIDQALYDKNNIKEYKENIDKAYNKLLKTITFYDEVPLQDFIDDVAVETSKISNYILNFGNNIVSIITLSDKYKNNLSRSVMSKLNLLLESIRNTYNSFNNIVKDLERINEANPKILTQFMMRFESAKNDFYNQMQKYLDIKTNIR